MALRFHDGQRELQDRFDTRRLADRLGEVAGTSFGPELAAFIAARDMFFLATADRAGNPDCSYKGGDPGFVRVVADDTLAFPCYDGNGMFRSLGNIETNPQVGMLFVDFESGSRLRVNGAATIHHDGDLVASFPGSLCAVTVRADAVFPNCRRYVHEYRKVAPSVFTPADGVEPPVPDWKRDPWFDGTLAADDPAHDAARPAAPAIPRF